MGPSQNPTAQKIATSRWLTVKSKFIDAVKRSAPRSLGTTAVTSATKLSATYMTNQRNNENFMKASPPERSPIMKYTVTE